MMKADHLDALIQQWTQLGAGFGSESDDERHAQSHASTPDLERLLLDTARAAPAMARLFIMAATWLHTYGDLVAKHRLKRLIRDELETEHRATLGILLDIAQQGTHPLELESVVKTLAPAAQARPLFDSERAHELLVARVQRYATPISRRWRLWTGPIELKDDAIRPPRWVMRMNPQLITRADFRGDLRASILASLQFDKDKGAADSELSLARAAGGSRAQIRNALDNLELSGRVKRRPARERSPGERAALKAPKIGRRVAIELVGLA